jgi:hypothetical protein
MRGVVVLEDVAIEVDEIVGQLKAQPEFRGDVVVRIGKNRESLVAP